MGREAITAELVGVLRCVRGKSAAAPSLEAHLISDLHMLSDEVSELALLMQDRTGIRPP